VLALPAMEQLKQLLQMALTIPTSNRNKHAKNVQPLPNLEERKHATFQYFEEETSKEIKDGYVRDLFECKHCHSKCTGTNVGNLKKHTDSCTG